ncbi:SDR family NAD(P)-dependent oxidoreductase [Paraburkholderia sp. 1N]|jgi:short-subunit dehydrogenase|uniref:SDR family NAD(P)-dependent oxidoreductase n=2 Tax=Paraburkholderia solitsugae TaxID=2675748 RepID=A0ABX2C1N2_9BURK|nr:SDR family NAD(P)-dependent oxidoreductase [Paraburkholderia solitsugae]
MSMKNLAGKNVLITGAGSGIGRSTALAFARRGARLVLSDINQDNLAKVEFEIAALGATCLALPANVGDDNAMRAFADEVHARVGAVDVLVNNAGIAYCGNFLNSPPESWQRLYDVNVKGVLSGCYLFLPKMIAAGGVRRVVNIASANGFAPLPTLAVYSASKFAVLGFSEALSMELEDTNVGVTVVCPGAINTAITTGAGVVAPSVPEAQKLRLQEYYRNQGTSPDRVADAIVDGVMCGRNMVVVGTSARPSYHVKRLFPSIYRKFAIATSRRMGFL